MGSRRTRRRSQARRRRGLRKGIPLGLCDVPPYVEIIMKLWCNKCEKWLEADEHFTKRKDVPRGYQYSCTECRSKQSKEIKERKKKGEVPKTKRGRPKGSKDRHVRSPRNHTGERREKMLKDAGEKIATGKVVAETPRSLAFILRIIVEQQLRSFYGAQVNGAPIRVRVNEIIADADFELKEALSRVNVRMKPILNGPKTPDVTNTLDRIVARKKAMQLLCVEEDASAEEIKRSYKKLALDAHPDRGGSREQMQVLNEARDLLLEEAHG